MPSGMVLPGYFDFFFAAERPCFFGSSGFGARVCEFGMPSVIGLVLLGLGKCFLAPVGYGQTLLLMRAMAERSAAIGRPDRQELAVQPPTSDSDHPLKLRTEVGS